MDDLLLKEIELYKQKTTKSYEVYQKALQTVPSGVSSCYQCLEPYPFYADHAKASYIVDVDKNKLIDFHGGYGVTLFGYQHPYIVDTATKFFQEDSFYVSLPNQTLIDVSEKLKNTFHLPYWRFLNSGTEATLDAIRLARARTNTRPYIIKVESGYHGHHDAVWVSVHAGARDTTTTPTSANEQIPQVPFCKGIPDQVINLTLIAEFNNIPSIQNLINKYPDQIAGVIVEPILLNCSMIKPHNGYLQALLELCHQHNMVVIFDLVKINTAIHMKHIRKYWDFENINPDMYTFGKGLSGGSCPVGAIGMTREFATIIESKRVQVSGTYNGNSYAMKIVDAVQSYVTEEKQDVLEAISKHMYLHCLDIIKKYKLHAIVDYVGNKGCITFFKKNCIVQVVKNYQEYIQNVDLVVEQLFVLFFINRGLWVQARDEWSISYQHTLEDANIFIKTFIEFAELIQDTA